MGSHPIHHHDADVGCRWLCESAGRRTQQDEEAMADALAKLPFRGHPVHPSLIPPVPLERVR